MERTSRRAFLNFLGSAALLARGANVAAAERPRNVLFIAVDDLRPELGCYGHALVRSPNIDCLAAEGVHFERAYCQQAICGPTRASLMTGLRPDSTGVTHNDIYFRDSVPDVVTLPQHFRAHGYETSYIGKVFHGKFTDDERSWSRKALRDKPYVPAPVGGYQLAENKALVKQRQQDMLAQYGPEGAGGMASGPATECADVPDNAYSDGQTAEGAIRTLQALADRPFFLAVGFQKPHLPFIAPKRYWDLYDPAKIALADNPFPPKDAPAMGLHASFELRTRSDMPKFGPVGEAQARHLLHGYLACVSYVDAQVGRVLGELDSLGLRDDTIVMLWGDHGWHLGDHGIWGKATDYEVATRAPLIVSAPGKSGRGACPGLVEFVDMYPTLCDLAGLPLPKHLEGCSFAPLLDDPNRAWKGAAFSQFPCPALREWAAQPLSPAMRKTYFGPLIGEIEGRIEGEHPEVSITRFEDDVTGYAMRTDRYRFVLWMDKEHPKSPPLAVELYDEQEDPEENVNIAGRPEYAGTVAKLTEQWYAGWRGALPK